MVTFKSHTTLLKFNYSETNGYSKSEYSTYDLLTNVELLNWIPPSQTLKANNHKLRKVQVESVAGREDWYKSFVDCTL